MDDFFNSDDGLTTSATIATRGLSLEGYLDADLTEFYVDNSGPSEEKYTYVCQTFNGWRTIVGQTLTIDSDSYTITAAQPDGTGLITLHLYAE